MVSFAQDLKKLDPKAAIRDDGGWVLVLEHAILQKGMKEPLLRVAGRLVFCDAIIHQLHALEIGSWISLMLRAAALSCFVAGLMQTSRDWLLTLLVHLTALPVRRVRVVRRGIARYLSVTLVDHSRSTGAVLARSLTISWLISNGRQLRPDTARVRRGLAGL